MHIELFLSVLFGLIFWHVLADYPLQGDFLSKAKGRAYEPDVPWWQAMAAHCIIHAGGVLMITQRADLALYEFIAHFLIDKAKVAGKINFNQDQLMHVACKVLYALIVVGNS